MLKDGQASPAYEIFSRSTLATVKPYEGSPRPIWAQVAATEREREVGLSPLRSLPLQEGMLFTFPFSGRHPFTLANTAVSLDVIFLRSLFRASEREVVAEVTQVDSVRAWTTWPVYPADVIDLVLEIGYGAAEALRIKRGSRLVFKAMQWRVF